ncbi:MAG: hypothetical protein LUQ50_11175 [Methanospirillum sp.]|uniref:hypothetical protein n=1 Tax=Methanospirillum sp. TaxID=45200 RepID=UPI002374E6DC|nr:hypothetical protein [Methanospirillum sp.]MDD1729616.1 hypothetical protein [Methanospirillum sp.]
MDTVKKIEPAQFFLKQMEHVRNTPVEFGYYLDAFTSATQKIMRDISTQVNGKPCQIWYENSLETSPLFSFFAAGSDLQYHITTQKLPTVQEEDPAQPSPSPGSPTILENLYESIKQLLSGNTGSSPGITRPIQETENNSYHFDSWVGEENVSTVCSQYVIALSNLVQEGENLEYIR